jgi:hypothetical protein
MLSGSEGSEGDDETTTAQGERVVVRVEDERRWTRVVVGVATRSRVVGSHRW